MTEYAANKRVVLIDSIKLLPHIRQELQGLMGAGTVIVPLSDLTEQELRGAGFTCESMHAYEYPGIYDGILPQAETFARDWYRRRADNKDHTVIDGISAGFTLQWPMIYYFVDILKSYSLIKAIIDAQKPSSVFILTGSAEVNALDRACPRSLAQIAGLVCRDVTLKIIADEPGVCFFDRVRLACKKVSARAIATLKETAGGLRWLLRGGHAAKTIIFFEGFRHADPVIRSLAGKQCHIMHLEKELSLSVLLKLFWQPVKIKALADFRAHDIPEPNGLESFAQVKEELCGSFHFRGVDLSSVIMTRIEYVCLRFLRFDFPRTARAIKDILGKYKPQCVVVENDTTFYERLVTIIAKAAGARTVVLQHGISIGGKDGLDERLVCFDFFPLTADVFLAWGAMTRDWLLRKGVSPERVRLTGCPRYDEYYRRDADERQRRFKETVLAGRRKLLFFALSDMPRRNAVPGYHITLEQTRKDLAMMIEYANTHEDLLVVVRPHHVIMQLWREMIETSARYANVRIDKTFALRDVMAAADVCAGYFSSVLLEASIVGVPAITLCETPYEVTPYAEYGLALRTSSRAEFFAAADRLLYGQGPERKKLCESIKENLYRFNYNNDGLATRRAAEYLLYN